jgi:hypothetical protein
MQDKKRTAEVVEDTENGGRKRQRCSKESITIHSPQPTTVEDLSDLASQSSEIAIPSKRRNPFGGGGPRKKNKTERYVDVRIYAQRRDLKHIHEIQCALTPDGGLDLGSLSQNLNLKGCQAS